MRAASGKRAARWRRPLAALAILLAVVPPAHAQLTTSGEIEIAADLSLTAAGGATRETVGLTLRGHLEVGYDPPFLELPLELRAALDPTLRVPSGEPDALLFEPGLTEAIVHARLEGADVEAGLLRRPLETARLSVPFRIEPVNDTGQPEGLLGAGASVYAGAWRIRPSALYRWQDDRLGGGASVRREFDAFDLEAHLFYLGGLAAGLGGSGLVGDIVVYGEAWLLSDPWDGRGALGLSGFAGDALWTAEAAYAPYAPGANDALPQLLGQLSLPLEDAFSLEADAGLAWVPAHASASGADVLRARGGMRLLRSESDHTGSLGVSVAHDERATSYALRVGVAAFF